MACSQYMQLSWKLCLIPSTPLTSQKDLRAIYGTKFSEKAGSGAGVFSIEVSGNWRVTFEIEEDGAVLLDYRDYHGKQIKAKK